MIPICLPSLCYFLFQNFCNLLSYSICVTNMYYSRSSQFKIFFSRYDLPTLSKNAKWQFHKQPRTQPNGNNISLFFQHNYWTISLVLAHPIQLKFNMYEHMDQIQIFKKYHLSMFQLITAGVVSYTVTNIERKWDTAYYLPRLQCLQIFPLTWEMSQKVKLNFRNTLINN